MKLPFVSRARYALLEHNFEKAREETRHREVGHYVDLGRARAFQESAEANAGNWKALFDAERIRCEALTQKLLDMKQQGFSTATQRMAEPPKEPSKIEATIAERAGTNSALRRHLTRWATQRQEMNASEDEIVDALTKWSDPDEAEA